MVHLYVVTRVKISVPADKTDKEAIEQAIAEFHSNPGAHIAGGEYAEEIQEHALVDTEVDGSVDYSRAQWYKEAEDQTDWLPLIK